MIELKKDTFECVLKLFPNNDVYVEPKSIVYKNNPGWVFVDSVPDPQIALIWVQGNEGFYLLGNDQISNFSNDLNNFIDSIIKPKLLSIGKKYFEISVVPPITDNDLENIFKNRHLESWTQSVYQYKSKDNIEIINNDNLYNVKDILKSNSTIENIDFIKNKITNYWDSIETFIKKADGFCIIMDNKIISMAITGWIAGNVHTIGIETDKNYRNKGYAKMCSKALLAKYIEKNFVPHWECEKTNIGSVKTAEYLGFTKLFDYILYGFSI